MAASGCSNVSCERGFGSPANGVSIWRHQSLWRTRVHCWFHEVQNWRHGSGAVSNPEYTIKQYQLRNLPAPDAGTHWTYMGENYVLIGDADGKIYKAYNGDIFYHRWYRPYSAVAGERSSFPAHPLPACPPRGVAVAERCRMATRRFWRGNLRRSDLGCCTERPSCGLCVSLDEW